MTGADVLSTIRVALAFLIAGAGTMFLTPGAPAVLLFAFLFGVATDIVGGIVARGRETLQGRVFDSIADEALVYGVLLPLARSGFPALFPLQLLLARDAVAVAVQVVAARQGQVLSIGRSGRLKTAILYMACAALLTLAWLQSGAGPVTIDPGDLSTILPFLLLSQLAIVVGLLLSLVTLFRYIMTLRSRRAA